jgi:hypothetical protein
MTNPKSLLKPFDDVKVYSLVIDGTDFYNATGKVLRVAKDRLIVAVADKILSVHPEQCERIGEEADQPRFKNGQSIVLLDNDSCRIDDKDDDLPEVKVVGGVVLKQTDDVVEVHLDGEPMDESLEVPAKLCFLTDTSSEKRSTSLTTP